jgi:hypothetical protein
MSAIRFPLTLDNPGAANPVSPQEGAKLSAGRPSSSAATRCGDALGRVSSAAADGAESGPISEPRPTALEPFPPPAPPPSSNANATAAAAPPTLTQQEQLAQLNRALEQLGISPQSISLDNRLALIRSANDPRRF